MIRIVLHAVFLIALNLFSLISGVITTIFLSNFQNDLAQSGIALIFNIAFYLLIFKFMTGIQKEVMHIDNLSMLVIMLISSLVLFPVVFIPLQYMISGNWQSLEIVWKISPFLLITNGLCLLINFYFLTDRSV